MIGHAARVAAAAALILAALAGCGRPQGPDAPPEPGDQPAARVAGDTIWISDVQRAAVAQGRITEGEPLDAASPEFGQVLDEVIDETVLAREAVARKLDRDPVVLRRLKAARTRVLSEALIQREVEGSIAEADVQRLYREFRREQAGAEEVRLRQIVTATAAQAAAAKRLLDGGTAFEAVALDASEDEASRFNGGDLGYVDPAALPAPIAEAVRTAAPNRVVGPVAADGRFVLLRVDDRRREEPRSLEELRPQILRFLSFEKIKGLLDTLRQDAEIERLVEAPDGAPKPQEPASAPRAASAAPAKGEPAR